MKTSIIFFSTRDISERMCFLHVASWVILD